LTPKADIGKVGREFAYQCPACDRRPFLEPETIAFDRCSLVEMLRVALFIGISG
jgi:hypothetical protein